MKLTYKHTKYTCYTAYICGAIINNTAPLLFVIFQNQFGIDVSRLALLITMNFGTQAIVDFFSAKFVDRVGYRAIAIVSQLFALIGLVGLGVFPFIFPSAYVGIAAATVCYAIGSGLAEVIISPIVEGLPADSKSGNMSLLHSFYCWGSVLVIVVTTMFLYIFGKDKWQIMCFLWAVVPIVSCALFTRVPINPIGAQDGAPLKKIFGQKILWMFMILMTCSGASELAMSQWASYFAETALGVSKAVGDILGACSFAVLMGISRVLYGMFSERFDLKKFMLGSAVLCVVSYALTALSQNAYISMIGCALCGFSVGIMWPGALSMAAEKYPAGGAPMFAILALSGDIGCFFGPELTAVISEHFSIHGSGLKAGFLGAIVFPVVLILTVCVINRKGAKRLPENQK